MRGGWGSQQEAGNTEEVYHVRLCSTEEAMTNAQEVPWKSECEHLVSLDESCPQCEDGASTDRDLEFMEDITFGDQ